MTRLVDRDLGRSARNAEDNPWELEDGRLPPLEGRWPIEDAPPTASGVARELRGGKALREALGLE